MPATHLADASAWAQLHRSDVAASLVSLVLGGGVATCALVDLAVLGGLDDPDEFAEALVERRLLPRLPVDDRVLDRALQVRGLLLGEAVPHWALAVAATAELAGLVVLHHDPAFDRIAEMTGQPVEWVG